MIDKPSPPFHRILTVHHGALGDFVLAWPWLHALATHFPHATRRFAGRETYAPWAAAAGFAPAAPDERAAVARLYAARDWDDAALARLARPLDGRRTLVVWFGVRRPPFAAALLRDDALWFLPTVEERDFAPPREVLGRMLRRHGVGPSPDWRTAWRRDVGAWRGFDATRHRPALLLPGAGHRAKQWPASHWEALVAALRTRNIPVRQLLGPAEIERGVTIGGPTPPPVDISTDLQTLVNAMTTARAVVGMDSGPLHAAAAMGAPTVCLFGPTAARQWAPEEARVVTPPADAAPCRPCAKTADVHCDAPEPHACMAAITPAAVETTLLTALRQSAAST